MGTFDGIISDLQRKIGEAQKNGRSVEVARLQRRLDDCRAQSIAMAKARAALKEARRLS